MKAHRIDTYSSTYFLPQRYMEVSGHSHLWPIYFWDRTMLLIEQKAGWTAECLNVLEKRKILVPAQIQTPDHPAPLPSHYTYWAIQAAVDKIKPSFSNDCTKQHRMQLTNYVVKSPS